MKFWFYILLISALFICPGKSFAAQKLFARPQSPLQLLEPGQQPKTITDYANLYYLSCLLANKNPGMADYNNTQCACTAAEMTKALSFDQAERLFSPDTKNDYYYARLMTLAYIPCLKLSVHDFVFDSCISGPENRDLRNKGSICECIAAGLGGAASRPNSLSMIPGYKRLGFNLAEVTENPFSAIVSGPALARESRYFTPVCMARKRYGG